nr:MAG TPA: hypothetical protein [Caudoviricetes sp.]
MLSTRAIMNHFDTLKAYEIFALEWAEACCIVNKNSRNKAEKERFEKAVRIRESVRCEI